MRKFAKYLMIVIALALVIMGLSAINVVAPVEAQTSDVQDYAVLNVNGEGIVTSSPDLAKVSFAVVTEEKSASEAQKENAAIIKKVINDLENYGIDKKSIVTRNFRVTPKYEYINDERQKNRVLTGYKAYHELKVELENIENVGEVIDLGIKSGVNRVNYVDFYLSDSKELYNSALKKAVREAKDKSQIIAETLGKNIIGIVEISEGGANMPVPLRENYAYEEVQAMGDAGTQIKPGELTIRANVFVKYKLSQ
jgi:hypothetical protein